MRSCAIQVCCAVLALTGCDIMLPEVGGAGEPCADNGACDKGLVCNFDECTSPREVGEQCDDTWVTAEEWGGEESDLWPESYLTCEEDLCCDNGTCAEESDWIAQPGADIEWNRCPEGSNWAWCHCDGRPESEHTGFLFSESEFDDHCEWPSRVPSRGEFTSMLGGCDSNVLNEDEGFCNACADSDRCSSMFTFEEYEFYTTTVLTSSFTSNEWGEITSIWTADIETGEIDHVTNMANFNYIVMCICDLD